jgi:hypothetical protein
MQPRGGVQRAGAAIGAAAAAATTTARIARNVNDTLRAIPLVPAFPPGLPATMATLLEQHKAHKLSQYDETTRKRKLASEVAHEIFETYLSSQADCSTGPPLQIG